MSVQIINADVFEGLAQLEDESIHCVVTSPPYWGLRDYGVDGQIGLEHSLGEHLDVMVQVFEEIRRVLRSDGTLWLNYGDAYATTPNGSTHLTHDGRYKSKRDDRTFTDKPFSTIGPIDRGKRTAKRWGGGNNSAAELKAKDLIMIPNRLAIALQEAGWWVRSEIIWHKPNPMPESVNDRPSCSHEKIFLLTKSARYHYDADAIKEPVSPNTHARVSQDVMAQEGSRRANGGTQPARPMKAVVGKNEQSDDRRKNGFNERWRGQPGVTPKSADEDDKMNKAKASFHASTIMPVFERNKRNVWTMATKPFSDAHFATFPPELAETCIKAGCPRGGVVLDPFGGAGTTALVADRLQRDAILIELNPDYAEMARRRLSGDRTELLDLMEAAS